uniref:3'-5' exonuclease domain-containing protein n=1 Tax=Romanomermis culicivorax TaxID=13658 RepID=A0A915HZ01_ROMCU
MGIVPTSLINLLQNARGIVGFASNCDLTALANVDIWFADIKIRADTSQIQRFLKSNRSIDYVRERNPDLYQRLVEGTADFYRAGNSLAAVAQHFFGVHLNKGFQGRELAWAKRPLPSDALEYAALDAIAHFDVYYCLNEFYPLLDKIRTLTSKEQIMTSKRASKREPLSLAILDFSLREIG